MRIAGLGCGRFQKRRIKQLGRPVSAYPPPKLAALPLTLLGRLRRSARPAHLGSPAGTRYWSPLVLVSPTLDRSRASLSSSNLEYSYVFFSLFIGFNVDFACLADFRCARARIRHGFVLPSPNPRPTKQGRGVGSGMDEAADSDALRRRVEELQRGNLRSSVLFSCNVLRSRLPLLLW